MLIFDCGGWIVLVNGEIEWIFGYLCFELIGQLLEVLFFECFRTLHRQHQAGYFAEPRVREMSTRLELWGRRRDGSEFPIEVSLSPLETEEGLLASSAIRDVSARREAEQALRAANLE